MLAIWWLKQLCRLVSADFQGALGIAQWHGACIAKAVVIGYGKEGATVLPLETLALIGAAAIFPYLAEGVYEWIARRKRHAKRANAPE